jgi:hypothetical protein
MWTGLVWRALVNSILDLRIPLSADKLSSGSETGGLSSSAQLHKVSYGCLCNNPPKSEVPST